MEVVELFKAFADETRIRIMNLLKTGEYCVCDIEHALEITQPNASRHLSRLKRAKIINSEKKAQWVYFSINDKILKDYSFIKELLQNNLNDHIFKADLKRLKEYTRNKDRCSI